METSGGTGYWYYKGEFFLVKTTHANFLLENYDLFGMTKEEVQEAINSDDIPATISDQSDERINLVIKAMQKGAIRIRFYRDRTSVQCYDIKANRKDLISCLVDGYGKMWGAGLTVMDTKGWGEHLNKYWGKSIKDFISESKIKKEQNYKLVLYEDLSFYRVLNNKIKD